jgi:hypothetical protein
MVKSCFQENNIKALMVPKRMTGLLQPADVCWMRPLKLKFKERWQNWLINEPRSLTAQGNWRSPGYATAINWISQIWDELDTQMIANSFKLCGITQSSYQSCHSQLKAFLDMGTIETVEEEDGADEIEGFDDAVVRGETIDEDESFDSDDGGEE